MVPDIVLKKWFLKEVSIGYPDMNLNGVQLEGWQKRMRSMS